MKRLFLAVLLALSVSTAAMAEGDNLIQVKAGKLSDECVWNLTTTN